MCSPSPVAQRAWQDDRDRYGSRVRYLGIKGDDAHKKRRSDHNCGQYSGYHPGYAHALDTGVDSPALGYEIVRARMADPRVKYCIFRGVGYYPHHRGGGTFRSSGHPDHVHTSFMPGTTFDTRPFYQGAPTQEWDEMATKEQVKDAMREVLNEGTGKGQRNWAGTNVTLLAVAQECVNLLRRLAKKLDA